jgi:hypothetical protein
MQLTDLLNPYSVQGSTLDTTRKRTVLVAVRPQGVDRLTNVLAQEFNLIFCHSLAEVEQQLGPEIDAVVCGTNFDESRMFELLRAVKADTRYKSIPFVCIKVLDGVLHDATYASVKKASTLMGASGFFDLAQARAELGKVKAAAELRRMLRQFIADSV